jgi:hypothetical protein
MLFLVGVQIRFFQQIHQGCSFLKVTSPAWLARKSFFECLDIYGSNRVLSQLARAMSDKLVKELSFCRVERQTVNLLLAQTFFLFRKVGLA